MTSGRQSSAGSFGLAVVLVALGAAAFAVAFRELLRLAFEAAFGVTDVVSVFLRLPLGLRVLLPALGGLLAGFIVKATAPSGQGHGVGEIIEAVNSEREPLSMRVTLLHAAGAWFAIVGGGSIGREGPLIQFGGNWGSVVGRWLRIDPLRVRTLMAAGTAAGFAAAYNTPIAAVLFVVEVVTGAVALDAILATVVATAIATAATRAIAGGGPIYGSRAFGIVHPGEFVGYAFLGIVAAVVAVGFMRLLSKGRRAFAGTGLPQPWRAALGGLIVGLIATRLPEVTGNGYEPLNAILDGAIPVGLVVVLLGAKALATAASVSSGSPGGVFTPTLFLGAALGLSFHYALSTVAVGAPLGGPGAYALVGMAATTAASTRAPVMATVLVFELSGDYAIVLPLFVATAMATLFARRLGAPTSHGGASAPLSTREGRSVAQTSER